ncbi:SAM-dependent methyltransferase [Pseudonocardia parietis]|uniref:SAM-dependent methyltransferase n=1 Tax=Pseudonocardia parietis TaxID=570936 RepID=A0ABS4W7T7_9PSEU|nr:methyltransferase domain-containing protein [Pseudonocardia parietis]MBP2372008.1 SAM-dependent methyltransferase [Pseudonocardia parietis]
MDARHWDERYEATELVWSAGPNATVAEQVSGLEPGTALDLGSGEGRNAVWLAEQGWMVTAVDFSRVATDKALAAARARAVTIDAVTADVTTYRPQRSFDLVLVAYLQLPWEQLGPVLATAAAAVAPGGVFLLVAHDLTNLAEGAGGPQDPAVLQTPTQVAGALGGLRVTTAERIRRPVEQEGRTVHAIDTLIRAAAP